MKRTIRWVLESDRIWAAGLGLFFFCLWIDLIFLRDVLAPLGFQFSDAVLLSMLPPACSRMWKNRGMLLVSPVVWFAIAIAVSMVLSTIMNGDSLLSRGILRHGVQLVLVGMFAVAVHSGGRRLLAQLSVAVTVAFLAAALLGGIVGAAWIVFAQPSPELYRVVFAENSLHPVVGNLPRFLGGISHAAEGCGLWAIAALSVAIGLWVAQKTRIAIAIGIAAIVLAFGTLSIAGASVIMVLPVLCHLAPRLRALQIPALVVAVTVVAVVQIPVHRGSAPITQGVDCTTSFQDHWASWAAPNFDKCDLRTRDDGSVKTRYAQAKDHAFELFEENLLFGVGTAGFRKHVAQDFRADGWRYWNPYYTTHGVFHGALAEQGIVGLLLYVGLFVTILVIVMSRQSQHAVLASALGVFFLCHLAAGIDLDVHKLRLFWVGVGLVAGLFGKIRARP